MISPLFRHTIPWLYGLEQELEEEEEAGNDAEKQCC